MYNNEVKEVTAITMALRWAVLIRIVVLSSILLPGMAIMYGPGSQFLSVRLSYFFVMTIFFSILEYIYSRGERSIIFLVYSHMFFDLIVISSVVDATGAVGSSFTFLYILLILEAGLFLERSGALMWATISSLVYLLLGILRFWGEGPLFSEYEGNALFFSGSQFHPFFDVFFPLSLFYLVALAIGFISRRLDIEGEQIISLDRELKRLSLESSDILRHVPTGVMTCDLSGKLVFANPACLRILGLKSEKAIGLQLRNLFNERHEKLGKLIERTIQEETPISRTNVTVSNGKEGENVYLGVSTSFLRDMDGVVTGVTTIFQDISDLRKMSALKRRTLRLHAMTELSTRMTNEIRNPLAIIKGSLEMLEKSDSANQRRNTLDVVKKESDKLLQLLDNFQRFARIRVKEWKKVDLLEMLEEIRVVFEVRPDITSRITVHHDGFEGEGKDIVYGNPGLLKQVFLLLFVNAVEAIEGQGNIRVRNEKSAHPDKSSRSGRKNYRNICVEDDGPGFSIETAAKAFDPFFTTKSGGNGLGLAIAQRIVEAHRGKIELNSREGEGSCFSLSLPAINPDEMRIEKRIQALERGES
jgi:PAS domain S-box-containing protein